MIAAHDMVGLPAICDERLVANPMGTVVEVEFTNLTAIHWR
jgi:hypothetical protein